MKRTIEKQVTKDSNVVGFCTRLTSLTCMIAFVLKDEIYNRNKETLNSYNSKKGFKIGK